MLKISVAMAVYNGSKYIEKQLDSILAQIRQPDEVIIVDDGSTDNTMGIVQQYINDKGLSTWKLFSNDKNLGYIRNFYRAISLTKGDIIFTCDQDDIWCDDKLESIAGLFAKYDDVLAVSSSFSLIDRNDCPIEKCKEGNHGLINVPLSKPFQKINLKTIMHSNISPGCTSAFRRNIADLFVRNSDNNIPHDYEINLIAAALGGLYFYNVPLIKYRIHENNTLGLDGKVQTRIEIAKEKQEAAEVIMKNSSESKVFAMYNKRFEILENGKFLKMLGLCFNNKYRRFLSIHERFGDIMYVLRSKK